MREFYYKDFLATFSNGIIRNTKMEAPFFFGNCNAKVRFEKMSIENAEQNLFLFAPNDYNIENPLSVEILNSSFKNNFFGSKSGLIGETNSIVKVRNSTFENNFSLERGGVVFAGSTGS